MKDPKISIIIVTYNHEEFVSQALDSVLEQNIDLIKEIIIGDDCSSDRTIDVIKEYQSKYPDLIHLVSRSCNVGVNENYADLFEKCSGEYTAILEGDDYWLPGKLDIMFNYMKKHKDAALLFHRFKVLSGDELKPRDYIYLEDRYIDLKNFISDNQIQNLSCCLYRTKDLQAVKEEFRKGPGVDYLLHILLLENNKGYFINQDLSVYRYHPNSIWSKLSKEHQIVQSLLRRYQMNELTERRHDAIFQENIDRMIEHLLDLRCYSPKTENSFARSKTKYPHWRFNVFGVKIKIKKRKKNA